MLADERRLPDSLALTTAVLSKDVRAHEDWPAVRPLVEKAMKRLEPLRATLDQDDPMHVGWELTEGGLMIGFTWDHGSAGLMIEETGPDHVKSTYQDAAPMKLNGFIAYQWWEKRSRAFCDMRADGYGANDVPYDDDPATELLLAVIARQTYRNSFSIKRPDGWGEIDLPNPDAEGGFIWRDPRGQGWGLGGQGLDDGPHFGDQDPGGEPA